MPGSAAFLLVLLERGQFERGRGLAGEVSPQGNHALQIGLTQNVSGVFAAVVRCLFEDKHTRVVIDGEGFFGLLRGELEGAGTIWDWRSEGVECRTL